MSISPEQEALIGRVFETYLTDHHRGDMLQLIADTDEEIHHTVVVNAMTLFEANMEIGDYFNAFPNDVLAIFDKVLHKTTLELPETSSPRHSGGQRTKVHRLKHTPHARITGLPVCPELTRDTVPRSRDVGHFLSVTGTVIRTSITKVLEYERDYMCAKCRHVFTVQADFDQFYTFIPPTACPNTDGCNSYKFTCLSGGSEPAVCRDYQEIKIQEQVQRLSVGSVPRSMVVILEDDLVDRCKSGDDVTVYGVMCQRWKPFYDGTRCDVELALKANNIEVNNQHASAALVMKDAQKEFEDFWNSYKHDPIAGRNQILLSLCPQVFGMYLIKLAVAMVLAGGVQRVDSSGTKIRGECHMLLVGDPGTGKSQFLKYAAKIIPRSVLTAGIGSTSAGLTVTAVKDGGEWHLEAGALVLSDGGLCCIDEFNSIKEHDRISIHEAMEQQSISVAKAGIVCKLNTRTTILAATNPKGQYDPSEPLSVNVALASPLLSRFDLVLVLLDTRNAEWDRVISSFILNDRGLSAETSSLWSLEKMKAYFSVIKRLQPQVSEDANSILARYYQLQRRSDDRNAARTTIRMLESLSRLAEAHARLMYRETVTIEDAVTAVSVMECSMQGGALLGNVNALLTSFPADPGRQYETQCQVLLEGLNLPLLLQKEMDRLARLKSTTSEDSPPAELRDTNSINNIHHQDITSYDLGNGLDWFQDIRPSMDSMVRPMITSTQENPNRKQNLSEISAVSKLSDCQSEKHTGSTLEFDVLSNPVSRITSAAEENNQTNEKSGTVKENTSIAEGKIKLSERLRDENHAELSTCVVQKVSKNLRERRLRELEQNHHECDEEEGRHQERTSVPADTASDSGTSSSLLLSKNFSTSNNRSSGRVEEKRDQATTKNFSAVLREKMEAEADTSKELRAQLSNFIFKPKKMRAPLRNINACSDLSAEGNPGRMSKQTAVSHEEDPLAHTKRNKRQKNTEEHSGKIKQISCLSEERDHRSEAISPQLDMDVFSFGQDKKKSETGVNTAVGTEVDTSCTALLKPSLSDPAQSKSGHAKTTVASSTLAKLSRFSFTGAETIVEKSPPKRPPPAKELTPGTESLTKTMSKCKGQDKLIEPVHAANQRNTVETGSDGCADYQSTVNLKKRKCFELGPPPASATSRGLFSGLSLFDSVDVLDTDWDQELTKTAKSLKS